MALTYSISRAELSSDPAVGKVTGDAVPGTGMGETADGVLPKLAFSDDEILVDLEALAAIFDAHDHDPANATGGGGRPIGTGGVRSIAPGAVIEALIDNLAVTGGKTAADAITEEKIADETVEKAQIGIPRTAVSPSIASGGTWTWTHGLGYRPLFSYEVDAAMGGFIGFTGEFMEVESATVNAVTFRNGGAAPATVTVRYYGG